MSGGRAPKVKGSIFERAVVTYLQSRGIAAERAYGAGRPDDVGDIDGVPGWCLSAKNHKSFDLASWIDEAYEQRTRAKRRFGAVIFKRPRKPIESSYVVIDLETFADLIEEMADATWRLQAYSGMAAQ